MVRKHDLSERYLDLHLIKAGHWPHNWMGISSSTSHLLPVFALTQGRQCPVSVSTMFLGEFLSLLLLLVLSVMSGVCTTYLLMCAQIMF